MKDKVRLRRMVPTVNRYFPRMVGLTPQGDYSRGKLYEIAVIGRNELGALAKLTTLLAQHRVDIMPSGGYYLLEPSIFIWTTFVDFSQTKSPLEYIIRDLRRLSFVTEVRAKKLNGIAFDQFLFPVVHMGNLRGAILSVEPLLRIEQRLVEKLGPPGSVIMFEEGRAYMFETVRQLDSTLSKARQDVMQANIIALLRTTGWGLFELDGSKFADSGEITVRINEPPNIDVSGLQRCNFVNGVAAGAVETVFKSRMRLESDSLDPAMRSLALVFKKIEQ